MDSFEFGDIDNGLDSGLDLNSESLLSHPQHDLCSDGNSFSDSLIAAHIAHGMDPVQAAMQARLDAPLIEPLIETFRP